LGIQGWWKEGEAEERGRMDISVYNTEWDSANYFPSQRTAKKQRIMKRRPPKKREYPTWQGSRHGGGSEVVKHEKT